MIEVIAPANPVAAVTHSDPYPYYDELVRTRPVYFDDQLAMWVVSSADAVSEVLTNGAFHVRPFGEPIPSAIRNTVAGDLFGSFVRMTDGAERDRSKVVVAAHVGKLDLAEVARVTEESALPLLAELGQPPDWHRFTPDFSLQIAPYVITRLLDIQEYAAREICDWLIDFVRCVVPTATPLDVTRGERAAERLIEAVRSSNGFVSDMARDFGREGSLSEHVGLANAVGLLFQSFEATAGLIGNALIELSRRPDAVEEARRDSTVLSRVVERIVREDSPVQNTRRHLAKTVTVLGEKFGRGDRVLVVVAAANRDPNARGRIFTFGAGAHACPGASMAMTIATKALECVLRQGTDIAPVAHAFAYRPSENVRIPNFF